MNQHDVYYRALLESRKLIKENRDAEKLEKAISASDNGHGGITVTRGVCEIDEEWVREIEKGLVFIEKAIHEERQFIHSNGEVLPIEKVKSVSKESVVHLERHSNLFTRKTDNGDMMPDKLYSVERTNDHTVYENRFLYMLLVYLRDFVSVRYDKILDAVNKYDGKLTFTDRVKIENRVLSYTFDLSDSIPYDKYMCSHSGAKDIIDRIGLIQKMIHSLISTPLMEMQAKVPLLRPPVTKTNILRMDNNFKGAVALYDYIIAYVGDGYSIRYENTEISLADKDAKADIAHIISALAFLAYEYGLGIKDQLKLSYEKEENARRQAEEQKKQERIEAIRRKIESSGVTPEEYVLETEGLINMLSQKASDVEPMRDEMVRLKEGELVLQERIKALMKDAGEFDARVSDIEAAHAKEMENISASYEGRLSEICAEKESEKQEAISRYASECDLSKENMHRMKEMYEEKVQYIISEKEKLEEEMKELNERYDSLCEQKRLCDARIHSYMYKNGEMPDDDSFTDEESFKTLEAEFAAFERFFGREWKKTKKRIRRDILSIDNLKHKD